MTTHTKMIDEASIGQKDSLLAWLGLSCMAAALLSGILKGVWEMSRPILVDAQTFSAAPRAQLWGYGILEVIKSAGFLAGLFGLYLYATKRGMVVKIFMGLAVLGGVFFAGVWMVMAATAHLTLAYVLGGMWYQMIAPVVLGIAALVTHRIHRWKAVWAIVVGVVNSQIFPLLGPGRAMLAQGIIWLALGYIVYTFRRST